jgi:5-(carboxyamino)imidazole ribonucleotide synthase
MKAQGGIPPGSVIGILGGGQLGRMLAQAAATLGFKVHIFAPEADSPAFDVAALSTCAQYTDEIALAAFGKAVDVVTYEFENVPVSTVRFLEAQVLVRPGSYALSVAQDRIAEKNLARELGVMTADYAAVDSLDDLRRAVEEIGAPGILKTRRFGYDGKGQAKIAFLADVDAAWADMSGQPSIYERFVTFDAEMSVIAARAVDGTFAAYDVTENVHRNHVLYTSTVPSHIDDTLQAEAVFVAQQFLNRLDYVGVMGVEFFAGVDVIYVNEIAPRVHNSGHWTMDGCMISQFEQHIRAVAGWPLGTTRRHSDVEMMNILGQDIDDWPALAADPGAAIHIYGKAEARTGRKMGHVNRVAPRLGART